MAKQIVTRIKNKIDTLAKWEAAQGTLLKGEIALVQVSEQKVDSNGKIIEVPALLMKVGNTDAQGNAIAFKDLPWLSAKAADVHEWAKKSESEFKTWLDSTAGFATDNELSQVAGKVSTLEEKVDVTKVSTAIQEAVKVLTDKTQADSGKATNTIVKAVTQANGQVSVTYGSITEAELPNISSSKVIVAEGETLASRLDTLGGTVSSLSSDKLDDITVTPVGTSGIVKNVEKNGKGGIKVTRGTVGTDDISTGAVTTGKIASGAVTNEKVATGIEASKILVKDNTYLNATVDDLYGKISSINTSIAGGVHFIGTIGKDEAFPSEAIAGDVIIKGTQEYIYNGTKWEPLGDVTRVGDLETKVGSLVGTSKTNEFVTHIVEKDGKFEVQTARPTAANVKYDDSYSVATKIEDMAGTLSNKANASDVYTTTQTDGKISDAINKLAFNASGSGNYVTGVTLTNGVVTVNKGNLPVATASAAGITKLYDSLGDSTDGTVTRKVVNEVSGRVSTVEGNYIKCTNNKLYMGSNGTDEIIFDCGDASNL